MATVLSAWTRLILGYAEVRGLAPSEVLGPAGVTAEELGRDRVDARTNQRIWQAADDVLGEPAAGVRLSETLVTTHALGVVGALAQTAPTIDQALSLGARYHRLIKESGEIELQRRPDRVVIHDWPGPDGASSTMGRWPRAMAEAIIANYVTLARQWTGAEVVPLEVSFQHERPSDTSELDRFFECPVRFGAETNSVTIDRDTAMLPLATWAPDVRQRLEDQARRALAQLGGDDLADVLTAVSELLDRGELLDIARVARHLATSPRSLQRRLAERKASFRALVDHVRCTRTVALLQTGASLDDIAERVGLSDERALRRALRRWTGRTARQVARPAAATLAA